MSSATTAPNRQRYGASNQDRPTTDPGLVVLGALTGSASWTLGNGDVRATAPLSVVGAAVLVAGVLLLAPAAGLGIGGSVLLALDAGRDRDGYADLADQPFWVASGTGAGDATFQ
jgi:hypothetical protein